ncbi:hypothetical protein BDZ89DRAFT_1052513 [Hymenopellis radicata]|nr:hypothetical protein BDZ89DRAFT_1052513 [Hymenopellis radicata]
MDGDDSQNDTPRQRLSTAIIGVVSLTPTTTVKPAIRLRAHCVCSAFRMTFAKDARPSLMDALHPRTRKPFMRQHIVRCSLRRRMLNEDGNSDGTFEYTDPEEHHRARQQHTAPGAPPLLSFPRPDPHREPRQECDDEEWEHAQKDVDSSGDFDACEHFGCGFKWIEDRVTTNIDNANIIYHRYYSDCPRIGQWDVTPMGPSGSVQGGRAVQDRVDRQSLGQLGGRGHPAHV